MKGLFDRTAEVDGDLFRNVASLREPKDLFGDLSRGEEDLSAVAVEAESRMREGVKRGVMHRGFYYPTAIGYPFMASRYGDGTFRVWYGALELETSIQEAVYHMANAELGVEGLVAVSGPEFKGGGIPPSRYRERMSRSLEI